MEFLKLISEAGQQGVGWGLFVFSFIINVVLFKVCHVMYKDARKQTDETNKAINGATTAITTTNTILQLLVGRKRS